MSEETKPATHVAKKNPGHRFEAGHPRWGGKKRNTAAAARAMAEEMGVDPIAFLLEIIRSDTVEQTVIENGKEKRCKLQIPLEMRVDAAKHVSRFCYPMLQATQISGPNEGTIETLSFDITKLLEDPDAVEAAQRLALILAAQGTAPAPARICGPADLEPPASDHNGHYL